MTEPGPLKAFAVVLRPSPALLLAFAAIVGWAAYLAWVAPGELRGPYVVLLLCQSFSAATGFLPRARRGHFDQILVASGAAPSRSRNRIGMAHAAVSSATGIAAWLAVTAIEAGVNHGRWPGGLAVPALAALFYMSALAWAASLPFARYSSGVVWLLLAIALAGAGKLLVLRQAYAAVSETSLDAWRAAGAALVFPPFMVTEPAEPLALSTFVVFGAGIVAIGSGILAVDAFDLPLGDES